MPTHEDDRSDSEPSLDVETLRELYDAAPDSIVVVAVSGTIVAANRSAERLFGDGTKGTLLGSSVESLIPPDAREAHVAHRRAYAASSTPRRMGQGPMLRAVRRDGSELDVDISIAPCRYHGEPAFVATVRDVTAYRKLEERMHQTRKLEALGSLAGGVAHDFNNLLSVILGYTSLLLHQAQPADPMREGLEQISEAGLRAAALTRQLLAFGRRQILAPEPSDLNAIFRGLEPMLGRLLREDVELAFVPGAALRSVDVDRSQLEQVLVNLVVNARDAMPGGGRVVVETANEDLDATYAAQHDGVSPGPHVVLTVSDTGHGMDASTRARAFEPFFTTKARGFGTGLGLATVSGIVEQSGGTIALRSEPGRGTSIALHFPASRGESSAARISVSPAKPSRVDETVLVVEDDRHVRRLAVTVLRRLGYQVIEAPDGAEALRIAERYAATIHLLLTDVVMPRMSGRRLADELRLARPSIRVLYMSGYTDDSIVHHGILDPGVSFVAKPLTIDALASHVREVLDQPIP